MGSNGRDTAISGTAIKLHEAVKEYRKAKTMATAISLIRLYFKLLGQVGGEGVAYELSGQELDQVHSAATITHRPHINQDAILA